MRKLSIYILLLMAAGCLSCCSDSNEKESGMLSSEGLIELRADYPGLSVGTKAIAKEFQTTLFCVARSGDYTGLSERFSTPVTDITSDWQNAVFYEEWVEREATVATNGTISWDAGRVHHYPRMGGNVYLVGLSPIAKDNSYDSDADTVAYTLDGHMDLMYSGPLVGNKWDGYRFSGNTDPTKDRSLAYKHLLTQLIFKAKKHEAGGLDVKVTKITVKNVPATVSLPLATGEATFSGTSIVEHSISDATVKSAETPTDLGCLYLPPLPKAGDAKITIETSIGTFSDVSVTMSGTKPEDNFQAGVSHEITLDIHDKALGISSVEVSEWNSTYVDGSLDLID